MAFIGLVYVAPSGKHPVNPQPGETYFNTDKGIVYTWDGNKWIELTAQIPETPIDPDIGFYTPEDNGPDHGDYIPWIDGLVDYTD